MDKLTRTIPVLLSFALMFSLGIAVAARAPGQSNSATKASTTTTSKNNAAANKTTVKSTAKTSAKKTNHVLAAAEYLSGTISAVDPSGNELTVVGSNGVPYDFDLTRKTQVESSNKNIGRNELASESHKQATIHFVPTSRGNMADRIQISAS